MRNSSSRNSVAVRVRESPVEGDLQLLRSSSTPPLERARGRGVTPELELDARDHFAHEKRFDDVIVGAEFQTHNAVRLGCPRGEKNDGGLCQLGIVADGFADVEPVRIGQHDVEQDEIRPDSPAEIQCATPVCEPANAKPSFSRLYFNSE